jgi:poly-gamma-glutamate capsule biosynthesis protein CapA/YwtB (metallophosphatase superfamily)
MAAATEHPTARLAILGDVMLGRLVSREIAHRAPESFWGDTLEVLHGADAVIANLECAISSRGSEWARTPKVFHFRAEPGAIAVLQAARMRHVSLANNHVLDYGEEAFLDTLRLLDEAGIARAGAGADLDEARRAARIKAGGISVTDNEPPFAAGAGRPGTCYVDAEAAELWPTAEAIRAERDAGAEIVLVSAHLGPNMVLRPAPRLRAFKRRLLAAGCDIVHGHSAHVFQGIEAEARRLILHDAGDFLDDYAVDDVLRNDWSFIFLVDIDAAGVRRLVLRPVALGFAEVNLARDRVFDAICERMVEQSAAFGTALQRCAEGLELALPAAG